MTTGAHTILNVITTNSVNFGAFGAFRWKQFFQLVIRIFNFSLYIYMEDAMHR